LKDLATTSALIKQIAGLINSTHSVSQFIEHTFEPLKDELNLKHFYVVLHDSQYKTLTFPYTYGHVEYSEATGLNRIQTPLNTVIEEQAELVLDKDTYLQHMDSGPSDAPPTLWMAYPILKDNHVIAILVFHARNQSEARDLESAKPSLDALAALLAPYLQTRIRLDQLEASEQKFIRFVETSIDISFQITASGHIDFLSNNLESRFGIDPKKLIGEHIRTVIPEDEVPKFEAGMERVNAGETISNMQITFVRSSGEVIPMEVSATPLVFGEKIIGAQGTVRDISETHKAQQEIERLAFFPVGNPMPVVEIDLKGVPSYINPAGTELLKEMKLDASQVTEILPKSYLADIKVALADKSPIPSREVTLEGLHLLWTAFFLKNQQLLHFYATDITNLKNTERELISAKERALKNEEVKTQFMANMSHEIRTPLNSILGFTELIEEEVKEKFGETLQAYFDTIYVSGKRLWETVHHILDISQIETGTFQLKEESIDLGKILRELGASFTSAAKARKLDLQINITSDEMFILSDEYCITQAITNLIDNAIKYTNKGFVRLDGGVHEGIVTVSIKDTGIGMSKEYQEQMFNVFSQESTGYTKNFQGMGLGLALAHRYITLIKGKINFESEQDVGSTFTMQFPSDPEHTSTTSVPSLHGPITKDSKHPPQSRLNILVVEDDPNSQKLATFTLSKAYDLFFAESVTDAKKMLETHEIQLVLLDLSLRGDEDGLELARHLRSQDSWMDLPIIALTAHAFNSDRERCMEAGCNDFMTKPFRLAELKATIKGLL